MCESQQSIRLDDGLVHLEGNTFVTRESPPNEATDVETLTGVRDFAVAEDFFLIVPDQSKGYSAVREWVMNQGGEVWWSVNFPHDSRDIQKSIDEAEVRLHVHLSSDLITVMLIKFSDAEFQEINI